MSVRKLLVIYHTKEGFPSACASYFKTKRSTNSWIFEVVKALEDADLDKLHHLFTSFPADIPYTIRRKENEREQEHYFHYTFYLILHMISVYTVLTEKEQSEGLCDCIIETKNDIYIFEFKLNGTAIDALKQIEDKGYARPYLSDARTIHKIGVSFSSQTGTIDDWKVSS